VVHDEFLALAAETGLTKRQEAQKWKGREDVEHIVLWGLRGWCPFYTGRRRPYEVNGFKTRIENALKEMEETAVSLDCWTREQLRRGTLS
jgi:hypothetical protein